MELIQHLKNRYKKHREKVLLKSYGCSSWEEYERKFDVDYSPMATSIKRIYHGYEIVHCVESYSHYAYTLLYDYGPGGCKYGYHEMDDWCKQNCKGKYRVGYHRVIIDTLTGEYEENGISGFDKIFFAFKEESDYTWFMLRWQ